MITPEQIAEWRKLEPEGMVSAVGEYTPEEFWLALDHIEVLQARIAQLEAELAAQGWQDIADSANAVDDEPVLLWCADIRTIYSHPEPRPKGVVMGTFFRGKPYGSGMNGDWTFTHWMPIPAAPQGGG
jgi:hypothetical protein